MIEKMAVVAVILLACGVGLELEGVSYDDLHTEG